MKITIWILQTILIIAFMAAGLLKVYMSLPDLIAQGMLWIADFSIVQVRIIGSLEVLAVLGMILPYILKVLPKILVPLAAVGLALTMVGGLVTHINRGDPIASIIINSVLLLMSLFVAFQRYKELIKVDKA